MIKLTIGSLSTTDIQAVVDLNEQSTPDAGWLQPAIELSQEDEDELHRINHRLEMINPHSVNEATIWSRAIYPLLILAERDNIRAYAQVPLRATYPTFEINGVTDGAIGKEASGRLVAPYLVVVEAKKGIGAEDPLPQLYAQLLAIAQLNQPNHKSSTEIHAYGAYTVADSWVFVRATVDVTNESRMRLTIESSREYIQRFNSSQILRIIRGIVLKQGSV
jgi:hypothetical protein